MVIADGWAAVGGIGAVVAAVAALITVIYARATVVAAREAREEAHRDHGQALAAEREAAREAVAEQRAAIDAAAAAHREEMADRTRTFKAEIILQRIVQLERVADVLSELIEVAQQEHLNPPAQVAPPSPFTATRIPAMIQRLRTSLAILDTLGAPALPQCTQLTDQGAQMGTNKLRIVSMSIDGLREIAQIAEPKGGYFDLNAG